MNQRCVCGTQAEVDNMGFPYNIEQIPTFYEIDEHLLGNGLEWRTVDNITTNLARSIFQDIRNQGPDPDMILNFATEWHNVLNAMWEENFSPQMLFGWQDGTSPDWAADTTGTLSQDHGLWAVGFGQWHKEMVFLDPVFGSNAQVVQLYADENNGIALDYDTAGAIAAGVLLYVAISSHVDTNFLNMSLTEQRETQIAAPNLYQSLRPLLGLKIKF